MIASQVINYLGINLAKIIKDMYTENYNTLLRDIKKQLNEWKDFPVLEAGRLNIIMMVIS